jgi:hypothetical protein
MANQATQSNQSNQPTKTKPPDPVVPLITIEPKKQPIVLPVLNEYIDSNTEKKSSKQKIVPARQMRSGADSYGNAVSSDDEIQPIQSLHLLREKNVDLTSKTTRDAAHRISKLTRQQIVARR